MDTEEQEKEEVRRERVGDWEGSEWVESGFTGAGNRQIWRSAEQED